MRLEYFQMVDRIAELDVRGGRIVTSCTVPEQSPVFEGHFPGHPLLPGVLMIETMAQTAGWLVISATRFQRMPFLAAVKEAKLRTFVTPGQRLVAAAELAHDGSGYAIAKASIAIDAKPVCSADLTFKVTDFPSEEFRTRMREWASRLHFPVEAIGHG